MNDKIINQISELMQVSYDKAIELYPMIKTQFLWYEFFDKILDILVVSFLLEATSLFSLVMFYINDVGYTEFSFKKYLKIAIGSILVTMVLGLVVFGVRLILAPDIVFVKGLLGGK